jgi:hypothetical protein
MEFSAYSLHRCALNIIFSFDDVPNFQKSGTDFLLIKHQTPKIPHIKLECVHLCWVGGVGGMIALIQFQILKENGTLLDKPSFLALKRCVKNIIIFISRYTRNFSLHLVKEVGRSIQNTPTCVTMPTARYLALGKFF